MGANREKHDERKDRERTARHIPGLGFRVQGLSLRVSGFRVQNLGFHILGSRFRV